METNETRTPEPEQNNELQQNNAEQMPPEELDDLQKKIHDYSEKQWNLMQRAGGAVVGLACGFMLTHLSSYESIGMYGTIGAALIALFVPRLIEKRVKRSVQKGRVALMIALGVWLISYMLFMLISGVPILSKNA